MLIKVKKVNDQKVAIIGAGPIGIECAVNLDINNINYSVFEANTIGSTIERWSHNTYFLSAPERLEIASFPFQSNDQQSPTGSEYLAYLRGIVDLYNLNINTHHRVENIMSVNEKFRLEIASMYKEYTEEFDKIILATGSMNNPKKLEITGENHPFVHNNEHGVNAYFRKKVLIVGDGNSALEKMIRCFRIGAQICMLIPDKEFPKDELRFEYLREYKIYSEKDKVRIIRQAKLQSIDKDGTCTIHTDKKVIKERFDFVITCIGYRYNPVLLKKIGINFLDGEVPVFNDKSMETNVKGVYLAGTIASGQKHMQELFVGTCHHHVKKIVSSMKKKAKLRLGSPEIRQYEFNYRDVQFPPSKI